MEWNNRGSVIGPEEGGLVTCINLAQMGVCWAPTVTLPQTSNFQRDAPCFCMGECQHACLYKQDGASTDILWFSVKFQ